MKHDLIRRGDAFTQFQKQYIDTQEGTDHVAIRINIGVTKCIHAMQDIPAVDAVEVVRCKDCRHNCQPPDKGFAQCERDALIREPEFWCRAGQRREDGAHEKA